MSDPLNQNPEGYECEECGEIADEFYDDMWLCEECILRHQDEDDLL